MDLHVRLFDDLRVTGDAADAPLALRPRARRLLAYLLLHRQRPLARERIAFTLWPDIPEPRALAAQRRALSELRAALSAVSARGEWLLVSDTTLQWNPAATCQVDIDLFEQDATKGTPAALYRAVELYAGDLLATWEDEWLAAERERLRRLQLEALHRLATHHRALGEYETAASFARRALDMEPLSERNHRNLIALLYLCGDRATALTAYDRLAHLLEDEYGVGPMEETRALREAIARGEPLPAINGAGATAPPEPTTLPLVIGREHELENLGALWEAASTGDGALVAVSGAAGVGKSTLLRACAAHFVGDDEQALTGYCYEFEQALPYQGILETLRAHAAALRHSALAPAHRAALAQLAPDLVGAAAPPVDGSEQLTADPRPQLFEALWQAFLTLGRGRPLLLVIEDVHWAAESTLDWLAYVAPRLSAVPVLLAITYRTEELDPDRPLARLTRRLARAANIQTLDLRPLSRAAHHELVVRLSGLPEATVAPLAEQLFLETAGNPLFLHEIVRALIETGQLAVRDGRWTGAAIEASGDARLPLPESVRALVDARLERLMPESRTFIQIAAVAGRIFAYDIIPHAAGWQEETALRALDDILARGFIEQQALPGDFRFIHHLIQEAIYAGMSAPRRRFWHRRLAEALQQLRTDDAGSLAYHLSRAGEDDRARVYYALAADRARQSAALEDAAAYYDAALERWPADDQAGRARLLDRLGQCRWVLGDLAAALEAFEAARGLYAALDNQLRLGDTERAIGRVHWERSDREASLRHYHRALAILEQEPESVELARTISALSQMHMLASELAPAVAWGERALELAERLGAEDVAIHAALNVGIALTSLHAAERGLALMHSSAARARAAGLPHDAMRAELNLGEQYFSMGRFAEAREHYDALLDEARRVRSDFFTGIALRGLVQLLWLTGQWAEALRYRQELLGWLRSAAPSNLAVVWASRILGTLHNDLGQPKLARAALERDLTTARAAAELQTTAPHLAELARAYASLGRDADAARVIAELLGWLGPSAEIVFDAIPAALIACHWLAARPEPERLDGLLICHAWLAGAERQLQTPETRAALTESDGLRLLASDSPAAATAPLRDAASGWEALGRPLDRVRALGTLANALERATQPAEARAARDRALALYDALAERLTDPELNAAFLNSRQVLSLRAGADRRP